MSIWATFHRWIGDAEQSVERDVRETLDWFEQQGRRAADAVEHHGSSVIHEATALIHTEEKELEMALSQAFTDALARIQAALSAHSNQGAADAQTISNLQAQVAELTAQGAAKDAQIAALTQQIAEEEAAVVAIVPDPATVPAPAPAPAAAADGSASADVTP